MMAVKPVEIEKKEPEKESGEALLTVPQQDVLPPWEEDTTFEIVGHPHTRVEGVEKVTGRARYAYDVRLPGQLYADVLRSPHPHARVTRVDTSKAEALEGVHAVIARHNVLDITWYQEEAALFSDTACFVGDEVAAVAAVSEEVAADALRLIEVHYELLPFVAEMEAALREDAPVIHSGGDKGGEGNRAEEAETYERGDVDKGFAEADVVIEGTYTTQTALHNALEPHGCTAFWQGDELTLYSSTQGIFAVREGVAKKLDLSENRVRVIKQHMGGGFGAKQVPWKDTVMAALLSKRTGRPVQLMYSREAENLAAGNRNPTRQRVRLGAKRDGVLTAISVEVQMAIGAYQVGGEGSNVVGI